MRAGMVRTLTGACAVALIAFSAPSRAFAGVVSTSGTITQITTPSGTLAGGTLESDATAYFWFENTVTGAQSVSVNHRGSGTVNSAGTANPGTLNATFVRSYMTHFDKVGSTAGVFVTLSNMSITFDEEIIGIIFNTTTLGNTDGTYGPSGLTYSYVAANSRGYELGTGATGDRFSISADRHTITILNIGTAAAGIDELRILLNPEPGTFALSGLGVALLGGLVVRRRRRRRAAAPAQQPARA